MSRALGGSCQVPLGGFAEIEEGVLRLRGFVASQDGTRIISDELSGGPKQARIWVLDWPESEGSRCGRNLGGSGVRSQPNP